MAGQGEMTVLKRVSEVLSGEAEQSGRDLTAVIQGETEGRGLQANYNDCFEWTFSNSWRG